MAFRKFEIKVISEIIFNEVTLQLMISIHKIDLKLN